MFIFEVEVMEFTDRLNVEIEESVKDTSGVSGFSHKMTPLIKRNRGRTKFQIKRMNSVVDVVSLRCWWAFQVFIISNRQLNIESEVKSKLPL